MMDKVQKEDVVSDAVLAATKAAHYELIKAGVSITEIGVMGRIGLALSAEIDSLIDDYTGEPDSDTEVTGT